MPVIVNVLAVVAVLKSAKRLPAANNKTWFVVPVANGVVDGVNDVLYLDVPDKMLKLEM